MYHPDFHLVRLRKIINNLRLDLVSYMVNIVFQVDRHISSLKHYNINYTFVFVFFSVWKLRKKKISDYRNKSLSVLLSFVFNPNPNVLWKKSNRLANTFFKLAQPEQLTIGSLTWLATRVLISTQPFVSVSRVRCFFCSTFQVERERLYNSHSLKGKKKKRKRYKGEGDIIRGGIEHKLWNLSCRGPRDRTLVAKHAIK